MGGLSKHRQHQVMHEVVLDCVGEFLEDENEDKRREGVIK